MAVNLEPNMSIPAILREFQRAINEDDGNSSGGGLVEVTYQELYNLQDGAELQPMTYYKITDFKTCYERPDYDFNQNKIEGDIQISEEQPIIVLAISNNELAPDAYQPTHPKDQIKYDIAYNQTPDNEPAFGRITERVDDRNNRTDYDHRNITFKRYRHYQIDFTNIIANDVTLTKDGDDIIVEDTNEVPNAIGDILDIGQKIGFGKDDDYRVYEVTERIDTTTVKVTGNRIDPVGTWNLYGTTDEGYISYYQNNIVDELEDFELFFTFEEEEYVENNYVGNNDSNFTDNGFDLANNVFIGSSYMNNKLGNFCYNNTFKDDCDENQIGDYFFENITNNDFDRNSIGNFFNKNKITANFRSNKIGNYFEYNYITDYDDDEGHFEDNMIGNNFYNNIVSYDFRHNTFGDSTADNFFNTEFEDNTIVNDFSNNTLTGEFFKENRIGNNFQFNTISYDFNNNIIGNFCKGNTISGSFYKNNIDHEFMANIIEGGFYQNQIGPVFIGNNLGSFYNNVCQGTFGNISQGNEIGADCKNNTFGNTFTGNTIATNFNRNQICSGFTENTIGDFFRYNRIDTPLDDIDFTEYLGQLNFVSFPVTPGENGIHPGVTASSTSGDGIGAVFTIGVADGDVNTVEVTNPGNLYKINDTITIDASEFGGAPGNDLVLTVTLLNAEPMVYGDYNKTIQKKVNGNLVLVAITNDGLYTSEGITQAID
jgi:hypothetical protein